MAGSDGLRATTRCERARRWASLRLDGELSHLEERLLERHLDECEDCRSVEARMGVATRLLREAPEEAPARRIGDLPARQAPSSRRRSRPVLFAAAALALGALVGSFVGRAPAPAPQAPGPEVSLLTRDVQQLRQLPRSEEREQAPVRSRPPNPPEGII